ncbi:hypothetical protein DPM19_15860 [Actinomadura craniellae]|uniref:Uncharacterized protein n=1 Tax=Actinomadura craniellae TaxID=2231787 RepID=A0A365H5R4_9ACTN|nr:hypothetical protein [Actinomadura craniellae]RAY14431.1 hypothetical protein DPM19_15860 [Actinomadura craniellae]
MNRPVRAAVESGFVMAAALLVIGFVSVVVAVGSPKTVAGDSFVWTSALAVIMLLLGFGGVAGALAARRLPGRRRLPLALVGPLTVMTLAAIPAAIDGDWAGVLLYEAGTLAGTAGGVLFFGGRR